MNFKCWVAVNVCAILFGTVGYLEGDSITWSLPFVAAGFVLLGMENQ